MSYSVVTTWSHKEAFHRDRFMFAKKSSESFFFSLHSISPFDAVQSIPVGECSGLVHITLPSLETT